MSMVYSGSYVEFPDGTQMTSYPAGWRNRIINGEMRIDQRNAGAAVTLTGIDSEFPVDRFKFTSNTTGSLALQQVADAPSGFLYSLKATVNTADAAPAVGVFMEHNIEGVNVADLGWGTANAQSITVSFRVKSSLTGSFGASVQNSGRSRSYPFSYTINAANTWETKTVTIAGDTTGTWLTDTGIGLRLIFDYGLTSSFKGTAGAWSISDYRSATGATSVVGTNGATFYITGVQLERGSVATPFDYVEYGEQLRRCQRYYAKMGGGTLYAAVGSGFFSSGTTATVYTKLPVTMRGIPVPSLAGTLYLNDSATNIAVTGLNTSICCTDSMLLSPTVASGGTQYRPAVLVADNAGYVIASAEL